MQSQKSKTQHSTLHSLTKVNNLIYITRTQRKFISQTLKKQPLEPITTPITPRPYVASPPLTSRKIIRTLQLKTNESLHEQMPSPPMTSNSIFNVLQTAEFKDLQHEVQLKRVAPDDEFMLCVPYRQILKKKQRLFAYNFNTRIHQRETDQLNNQVFLKKIQQTITSCQITEQESFEHQHQSFLSEQQIINRQLSSPKMTFNQLSIIPYLNQNSQIKTMGTNMNQIIDAIQEVEKKPLVNEPAQRSKKKIQITITSTDKEEKISFNAPHFETEQREFPEPLQILESPKYVKYPKHVLKTAIQQLQSAPLIKNQTRFSKSILKIVGLEEESEQQQIFTHQKTRRYFKLYLQNKMQQAFSKLDEDTLRLIQSLMDRQQNSLSPSTSRLLSGHTNQINYTNIYSSYPSILVEMPVSSNRLSSAFQEFSQYIIEDNDNYFQYDVQDIPYSFNLINCRDLINLHAQNTLPVILNELDESSRNHMLSDTQIKNEFRKMNSIIVQEYVFFNQVNRKTAQLLERDRLKTVIRIQEKYNDILQGVFEDMHEIQNDDTQFLEFEEPKCKNQNNLEEQSNEHSKTFVKAVKKAQVQTKMMVQSQQVQKQGVGSTNKIEMEASTDLNKSLQSKTVAISPRLTKREGPKKTSLLDTLNSSVTRRHTDSPSNNSNPPQDELSTKEKEQISGSTMTKKKETIQAEHSSSVMKDQRAVRNLAQQSSMSKHSLLMRSHLDQDAKKKYQTINKQVSFLIQQCKFDELVELFTNNPNIIINERMNDCNTFLIMAAQTGSAKIVELLINKGAAPNVQNADGDTALHKAMALNHYECADILIRSGASQAIRNLNGQTPWQIVSF